MGHLGHRKLVVILKNSPYHPQTNGVLERLHATLEAMFTKVGTDWVLQLPFTLFEMPNRSTGFSPYELLYRHNVRTPLVKDGFNVRDWVELVERLECNERCRNEE